MQAAKYAVIYPLFTNVCKLVFVRILCGMGLDVVRRWPCTVTVLPLGLSKMASWLRQNRVSKRDSDVTWT